MVITVSHHNYKETKKECRETKPKVPTKDKKLTPHNYRETKDNYKET